MKKTVEECFWPKVEKTDGCWNWTGARDGRGYYGMMTINRKRALSHRVAWEIANGPIPPEMVIDHICRNKACVRPDHLRLATGKQNRENLDGAYANSKSGVRGVCFSKSNKKWQAYATHGGERHHGGFFTDFEEAAAAVVALRNRLFTHNDMDRAA